MGMVEIMKKDDDEEKKAVLLWTNPSLDPILFVTPRVTVTPPHHNASYPFAEEYAFCYQDYLLPFRSRCLTGRSCGQEYMWAPLIMHLGDVLTSV